MGVLLRLRLPALLSSKIFLSLVRYLGEREREGCRRGLSSKSDPICAALRPILLSSFLARLSSFLRRFSSFSPLVISASTSVEGTAMAFAPEAGPLELSMVTGSYPLCLRVNFPMIHNMESTHSTAAIA